MLKIFRFANGLKPYIKKGIMVFDPQTMVDAHIYGFCPQA